MEVTSLLSATSPKSPQGPLDDPCPPSLSIGMENLTDEELTDLFFEDQLGPDVIDAVFQDEAWKENPMPASLASPVAPPVVPEPSPNLELRALMDQLYSHLNACARADVQKLTQYPMESLQFAVHHIAGWEARITRPTEPPLPPLSPTYAKTVFPHTEENLTLFYSRLRRSSIIGLYGIIFGCMTHALRMFSPYRHVDRADITVPTESPFHVSRIRGTVSRVALTRFYASALVDSAIQYPVHSGILPTIPLTTMNTGIYLVTYQMHDSMTSDRVRAHGILLMPDINGVLSIAMKIKGAFFAQQRMMV